MEILKLKDEYNFLLPRANSLCDLLFKEINSIILNEKISLGVPIERRIKEWKSIKFKIDRLNIKIKSIKDLNDLIGIRTIFLFKRDVNKMTSILKKTFNVISYEDAGKRLDEKQFGYQSIHLVIKIPKKWLKVPSFKNLSDLKCEIQIRTLSQHIWATASHKLQYKIEKNVPKPIRRSINRVSALLEIVDSELERFLDDRKKFISKIDILNTKEELNVDIFSKILDEYLPKKNKNINGEDYSDLLKELFFFKFNTTQDIISIIKKHLEVTLKEDKMRINTMTDGRSGDSDRIKMGVFFTHVGLIRTMLRLEVGKKHEVYIKTKKAML